MSEISDINALSKQKFNWRLLGENFVFQHENNFYKMPSFVGKQFFYRGNNSYDQANINFKLIQKYFGKVIKIAPTTIMQNTDGHFVIKQKMLCGNILTKKDLQNNYLLLSKFKKLVIINEVMWEAEGCFLDLLGSDFALKPNKIHNLITDGKDLYIFDFGLFHKRPQNIIVKTVANIATYIQMFIIKHFWDK